MKKVVSISLGSSDRNHKVKTKILGTEFEIERIGTDGNMVSMIEKIEELDGKVDVFGLGGIDLYLYAGQKRYTMREAEKISKRAIKTPIVDGSGLKNTLERRTLKYLTDTGWVFKDKKVLMVCALDRFGMAQSFEDYGSDVIYGDLIFSVGIPIKIYSLNSLYRVANILMPVVKNLPFKMLYPTGSNQNRIIPKYASIFNWADIIAGDFHLIKKHLPEDLSRKTIITNTVTSKDIDLLHRRDLDTLVTTTPEFNGRSFGTNVMEGVLVALSGKHSLVEEEYDKLLEEVDFRPRIIRLRKQARRIISHG